MIATSEEQLRQHIKVLEKFCEDSSMRVNLTKTRWFRIGAKPKGEIRFQGQIVEECESYKYLGVQFAVNMRWVACIQSRVSSGLRALFTLWNRCCKAHLFDWGLRRKLFCALIMPVLLYGVAVWGPTTTKSGWLKLEKNLREELSKAVVRRLWCAPSPRQSYYLKDISSLYPYAEKSYLRAGLPRKVRQLIAQFRVSSHTLRIEEGR
ncbi:hypothetical protein R1sor_027213 [Riccia sorocarpa]|uniref:Reverse transcriptase n=1 Tax=Riccia sorocarpa TaxID=122646 RepID=A0ABD3GDK8_9MARC